MKFRKKPIVIEAVQFLPNSESIDEIMAMASQGQRQVVANHDPSNGWSLSIETLEGRMTATIGDWIIRGVGGELYPCKPDIFIATYERVEP